jgi:hypothetical protein
MIFLSIGIVFLLNAVFGRYLVLPGYLSGLEAGRGTIDAAILTVPFWKIIRYLVWAYSFKIGIFFIGLGVLLKAAIPTVRFWSLIGGGILYLLLAYVPLPGPYPHFFGIGGGLITVLLIFICSVIVRDTWHRVRPYQSWFISNFLIRQEEAK